MPGSAGISCAAVPRRNEWKCVSTTDCSSAFCSFAPGPPDLGGPLADREGLDPHLADVSRFVAHLLLRSGRPAAGVVMMESAGRLYGPKTKQGRATLADAEPAGAPPVEDQTWGEWRRRFRNAVPVSKLKRFRYTMTVSTTRTVSG